MLKFSTRGQYALLVMTDLAEHNSEKYVPLKLLSHRRNLSVKYLEQILIQLANRLNEGTIITQFHSFLDELNRQFIRAPKRRITNY